MDTKASYQSTTPKSDFGKKTGCVIITFNPDIEVLRNNIKKWIQQGVDVVIVDNSPERTAADFPEPEVHYIAMDRNEGIARAQNVGAAWLIDNGYELLLFSDQDTQPSDEVAGKLTEAYCLLAGNDVKIAAIGTRAINSFTNELYDYKTKLIDAPEDIREISPDERIREVYSVISSVSLIPAASFLLNGGFDESLFIDGVDHEWCWRAWHSHRLRTFIIEDAIVTHSIGEGDRKCLGSSISIPSSARVYYQYRNFIRLCRRPYTPSYWKRKNLTKYAVKLFYYPLMVSPRLSYLKNMAKGIRDGFFKKE